MGLHVDSAGYKFWKKSGYSELTKIPSGNLT
jgi:hypothetical protein